MTGIYSITCVSTGKTYIGSSENIQRRWSVHKRYLIKGNHQNIFLQRAWNKYGEINFRWDVIEITNLLIEREQYFLDVTKNKFNLCPIAYSRLGFKTTEKTRKKISASNKIWRQSTPALESFRPKRGKDHHLARAICQFTKDGIFIRRWETLKEAANSVNGHSTNLISCVNGKYKQAYGFVWKNNSQD